LLVTGYVTQQSYNILNEDICHDNNRLENAKIKRKITHFTSLGQLLKKVKEKEKHHIMKKIMLPTKKAQKTRNCLKSLKKNSKNK
jgi:t-SNARE complex subunit (syntaxin)